MVFLVFLPHSYKQLHYDAETILQMPSRCWPDCLVTPVPSERLRFVLLPLIPAQSFACSRCAHAARQRSTLSQLSVFLDQLPGRQTQKASEAGSENSCELREYGTSVHGQQGEERRRGGHRRSTVSQAAKSSLIRAGNPERVTRCPRHHLNMCLINGDGTWRQNLTLNFYSAPVFMREIISVSKR